VGGLTLSEVAYPSGAAIPSHSHEWPYFCVALQGSYSERYDNRSRECTTLDLLFHPAGEIESQSFHEGGRCFTVEMGPQFVRRVTDYFPTITSLPGFQCRRPVALGMNLFQEFQRSDEASPLAIEGLGLELVALAVRYNRPDTAGHKAPSWLDTVQQLLRERFMDHLTLNEIARSVGAHPVQVARHFRKVHHISVAAFLRRQRIDFACQRLLNSEVSLSQIALEAGFFDQSHFARAFRRAMGMRPTQFAALARKR
jgi:AraC family transcriptional regulator